MPARLAFTALALLGLLLAACGDGSSAPDGRTEPLPSPVAYGEETDAPFTLGDPAFEALPGAQAYYGELGGSAYQIEIPDDWNGRLLMYMHGYGELEPEIIVSPPLIRPYLILSGYAWAASSFSSNSSIPGRSADETAALWDYFVREHGRPEYTYVTGQSMGGAASHIAAERYPDRFDGALGLCGSAGQSSGGEQQVDFFTAAAYIAGVTQSEFDTSADIPGLVESRILPVLDDPAKHEQWENIMIDLTGGPRSFDREGFHSEEPTNWERSGLIAQSGLATNEGVVYQLGPMSDVDSDDFNRDVIRVALSEELARQFTEGEDTTGDLQMPLISLHTTGDGQVPFIQAQFLQKRVDSAGRSDLLVQRVFRDPGHCGFNAAEWEANFDALVAWVEDGDKPDGQGVLVDDLTTLAGEFELAPRPGSPEAEDVPGASERVTLTGDLTLDGQAFDSTFLGAVVMKDGLITPCQYTLPTVEDGRYEITVKAESETHGCGEAGGEVFLWTYPANQQLWSSNGLPWPDRGSATFDAAFSSKQSGVLPPTLDFAGDAFDPDGQRFAPGTTIEARIGDTVCGRASMARTGSFSGFVLSVVGPESVPACEQSGTITFYVDGRRAAQTKVNDPELQERGIFTLTVE